MFYSVMENVVWFSFILIVLGTIIIFVGLHYLFQKIFKTTEDGQEVVSAYAHNVGIIYAVLLGFLAVNSWDNFNKSQETLKSEVNALADLYGMSNYFSQPMKQFIQNRIINYVNLMISEEWPAMQHGEESLKARKIAEEIISAFNAYESKMQKESIFQQSAIELKRVFLDARRERIGRNQEAYPLTLVITLVAGAGLTLFICFLFFTYHKTRHLVMTGILSAMIGFQLGLINEFEYPYRGLITISTQAWSQLLQEIESTPLDTPQINNLE